MKKKYVVNLTDFVIDLIEGSSELDTTLYVDQEHSGGYLQGTVKFTIDLKMKRGFHNDPPEVDYRFVSHIDCDLELVDKDGGTIDSTIDDAEIRKFFKI